MTHFLEWLTKYEAVAVWLEGIALVAIFIWDRVDAKKQLTETLKQIDLAQKQIEASHNAERAWIMAELDWYQAGKAHIQFHTQGGNAGEGELKTTTVTAKLTCSNEGRSPAWIKRIYGYGEIAERVTDPPPTDDHATQSFITLGPIGPGKEQHRSLMFICIGHLKQPNIASLYLVIEYLEAIS
jgi:hypothetical protein